MRAGGRGRALRSVALRAGLALALSTGALAQAPMAAEAADEVVAGGEHLAEAGSLAVALAGDQPIFSTGELVLSGTAAAPAGSVVEVTVAGRTLGTVVEESGAWTLRWPEALEIGSYPVEVVVLASDGRRASTRGVVAVGRLPRRPLTDPEVVRRERGPARGDDFEAMTDRWRIALPPYELDATGGPWNPYDQNVLKGDYPVIGDDVFFVLTAIADTLGEGRTLPTPAGISTEGTTITFFGGEEQGFLAQTLLLSAELFKGDTAFRPIDWRLKATLSANLNYLAVEERAAVNPDVREGITRTDDFLGVQELFAEVKLADLSPQYDFVSVRAGVQLFNSDFRGFVFNDQNLGVRLFGNWRSNRYQYNVAYFDRLEKDTNSGLNTFDLRDQQVGIVNLYRQDTPFGHTVQVSYHYLRDEPSFHFDENGFLARPDPIGDFTPHEVEAHYLGYAGFGHFGKINVDSAVYYAFGEDSLNPIAGRELVLDDDGTFRFEEEVDISAWLAALELSIDRNWYRPKIAFLYASGDDDLNDRDAEGFDSIFESMAFAGGGFTFWNRVALRLAGTGVALTNRGSFLNNMKTSKEEGQPNFVNPGLHLASLGLDVEVTPKVELVTHLNYLRFDATEVLEGVLFQAPIDEEIGFDVSVGARWRPLLNENVVLLGGVAALFPGDGFEDIYEDDGTLVQGFLNLMLRY